MKKNSLALIVFAAAMLVGAFAHAECGKVAGYDEKGNALYYDDCTGMDATTNTTLDDITFKDNNNKMNTGVTSICSKKTGCAKMNTLCACTQCESGYTLKNGSCTKDDTLQCTTKPTGCAVMSSSCICTQCESGYTLSGGICTKSCTKPTGCATVDSSCACTACNAGYKLENGACTLIPPETVTSCPDGMKKSSDGCCCIPV